MEGKSGRAKRAIKVQRHFELSRLERELLAAAYERVLPYVSVRLPCAETSGGVEPFVRLWSAGGWERIAASE
jgi:hypothetical protein